MAVATITDSLSCASTRSPIRSTPVENGVSIFRSSVPQIMPAIERRKKPSPIVAMTIENCGLPSTGRNTKRSTDGAERGHADDREEEADPVVQPEQRDEGEGEEAAQHQEARPGRN